MNLIVNRTQAFLSKQTEHGEHSRRDALEFYEQALENNPIGLLYAESMLNLVGRHGFKIELFGLGKYETISSPMRPWPSTDGDVLLIGYSRELSKDDPSFVLPSCYCSKGYESINLFKPVMLPEEMNDRSLHKIQKTLKNQDLSQYCILAIFQGIEPQIMGGMKTQEKHLHISDVKVYVGYN